MSDDANDVRSHLKVYITVFFALAILTVITVLIAGMQFGVATAIVVALIVAAVKGSLVALYFMHLQAERKLIYATLVLTVIFFFALILLPLFAGLDSLGLEVEHIYGP